MPEFQSTTLEGLVCPNCKRGASGQAGSGAPKAGDYSVCIYCEAPARFNENMQLQLLTPEQQYKLCVEDPDCWDLITKTIRQIKEIKSQVIR